MKKIYIALILISSLTLHYNVQAQESGHSYKPSCSSTCHHKVDVEICHEISSAKVVSDTSIALSSQYYSFSRETYVSEIDIYVRSRLSDQRTPSFIELARAHI